MIEIVSTIVRDAGAILLRHFQQLEKHSIIEKTKNDFVSIADKESEAFLIRELKKHFPNINVLAEESGYNSHSAENTRWIIDPLDGTRNFIQGIPYFAISIALERDGVLELGIVYDPVHNDMFSALRGQPAQRNGQSIYVSDRQNFGHAFLATGFPFRSKSYFQQYQSAFTETFQRVSNIRRCGAAALDMAYTAAGQFDGFWEIGLNVWDIAAGTLLIESAGGTVSDFWGGQHHLDSGHIVAGNTAIHHELKTITTTYFNQKEMLNVQ